MICCCWLSLLWLICCCCCCEMIRFFEWMSCCWLLAGRPGRSELRYFDWLIWLPGWFWWIVWIDTGDGLKLFFVFFGCCSFSAVYIYGYLRFWSSLFEISKINLTHLGSVIKLLSTFISLKFAERSEAKTRSVVLRQNQNLRFFDAKLRFAPFSFASLSHF